MPIKISVAGLAQFMNATSFRQRRLLRDHKFPFTKDGHRKPQIVRYSEARSTIQRYHSNGNDVTVLLDAVEALKKKAAENPDKDPSRIEDNIRAIKTYMKHFQNNQFEVLENPRPRYIHGEVHVTTAPDLYVDENGTKKLIKLDFNAKEPKEEVVNIILKVMHEAAAGQELGVKPADVIYLDVSRQRQFNGKKLNKQLKRDIDAACETIADIWPKVKQS
jgi:endo-alpha-1,4-polygalactosaminidase (GH114 family)